MGETYIASEVLGLAEENVVGSQLAVESGREGLDARGVRLAVVEHPIQLVNMQLLWMADSRYAHAARTGMHREDEGTHGLNTFSNASPLALGSKLHISMLTACSKIAVFFKSVGEGMSLPF